MNDRENKEAIDFFTPEDAKNLQVFPETTPETVPTQNEIPEKKIPEKKTQRPAESTRLPKVVLSPAQLKKKKKNKEPDIDEELLHRPYGEEPLPKEVTPLRPEWRAYPELETLYEYVPEVVEEVLLRPDYTDSQRGHVDLSINAFTYLKSLGYKEAIWQLGQEFDYNDCNGSCSANAGKFFNIDNVITTSDVHSSKNSYFPDKPFVALAHPSCRCSMTCFPPYSINDIPDSAPYLPMNADKKLLKVCKEKLLSLLQDIDIDRWTSLYNIDQQMNLDQMEDFYDNMKHASSNERIKTAEWEEKIIPIKLKRSFMLYFPMGIIRPVPANYIGFQLSRSENLSKIYLVQLGYVIEVSSDLIQELVLAPSDDLDIKTNPFVMIDGELGIIIFHHDYEDTICYLPEFDEKMSVDSFQVMKIVDSF